jgi:RNA polymerase sigma-70 factor (ECF subfamily)
VKTWLHTTLYREFLALRRRALRFGPPPTDESPSAEEELQVDPEVVDKLDGAAVVDALMDIDELYRAPLVLFYLEDLSYQEISEALDIPPGTVMSRLSRGKNALRRRLADTGFRQESKRSATIVPLDLRKTAFNE